MDLEKDPPDVRLVFPKRGSAEDCCNRIKIGMRLAEAKKILEEARFNWILAEEDNRRTTVRFQRGAEEMAILISVRLPDSLVSGVELAPALESTESIIDRLNRQMGGR